MVANQNTQNIPTRKNTFTVFVLTDDGAVEIESWASTRGKGRANAAAEYHLPFISAKIVVVSNRNWNRLSAMYDLVWDEVEARREEEYQTMTARQQRRADRTARLEAMES